MGNFIRALLYSTITVLVQFLGILLQEEVAKDIRGLLYGIPILLFILACWQGRKIFIYKKRARMAEHPAPFHPDCIDCYVRFTGRLAEGQNAERPFSGKQCAFYVAAVQAEWTSKQKKPGKGMVTHRKHLMRDQSAKELAITDKEITVYIPLDRFNKDQIALREYNKKQASCPPEVIGQQNKKHPLTYHLLERSIDRRDTVSVQGRLVQKNDGRLFIEGTGLVQYPSFIVVHQRQAKEQGLVQFIEDLQEKAETDACNMGLRAFFLALNGAVFLLLLLNS